MHDISKFGRADIETMNLNMMSDDTHGFKMTGQITDRIFNTKGELIDTIVDHNLIVNSFTKLIMALMRCEPGYSGIQYWAIGSGDPIWDQYTAVPSPFESETKLTSEITRVPILPSDITYLNVIGEPTSIPTNVIQIKKTFGTNDCNGIWREFAIFGGNATSEPNSGVMINKKHHGRIDKTSEMIIERTMKFTLSLS